MNTSLSFPRVAIIGAGIIGLSCAWEMAKRGAQVTIYEKDEPGRGASWAAAGMLAPAYEAAAEDGAHPRLIDLCMKSGAMWPEFAATLGAASEVDVRFSERPSLAVAVNPDQSRHVRRLREALDKRSVPYERLSVQEARSIEPGLTENLLTAVKLPTDGQVDNRRVIQALIVACQRAGVAFEKDNYGFYHDNGRISFCGEADHFLICAGVDWHGPDVLMIDRHDEVGRLSSYLPWAEALSPVKGQALSLARQTGDPAHVVRAGGVYCAPKADRLVIGATVEPHATGLETRERDILNLLSQVTEFLPGLKGRDVLECWAGLRPHSTTGGPLLGLVQDDRLWVASGHYRNGILLAPVTAQIMADMMLDGKTSALAEAFSPARFASATA